MMLMPAYLLSLVFSVAIADTDVRLDSAAYVSSSTWVYHVVIHARDTVSASSWRALNVLRLVGCTLGWLLLLVDEWPATG
jgi:hypothetical protein